MIKTALEASHSHFAFSLTLHPLKTEDIETVKEVRVMALLSDCLQLTSF